MSVLNVTPKLSAKLLAEIAALQAMPDEEIDTSDIPERVEDLPVYVGLFHPGGKKSVTIRLDFDMVDWFRSQGRGWQTKINWILRLHFASQRQSKS